MPDIAMCKGGRCPQKDKCYRFTATPSEYRQSYFTEAPFKMDGCPYFMRDESIKKHIPKQENKT